MNRQRFMSELRQAIEGLMPQKEIEEVLSDHEEFFEAGLADGDTEEQVAERLGDPAKIALSLLHKDHPLSGERVSAKPETYRRVLAFVIDILIASLPFMFISPRTGIVMFFIPGYLANMVPSILSTIRHSGRSWIASARFFWTSGVVLSSIWLLFGSFLCLAIFRGRTLGKWLSGLRVVKRTGERATPGQCFAREVLAKFGLNALCGYIWLPLAFAPALTSLVWSLLSPDGMTIWDAIAGTRVVEAKSGVRGG